MVDNSIDAELALMIERTKMCTSALLFSLALLRATSSGRSAQNAKERINSSFKVFSHLTEGHPSCSRHVRGKVTCVMQSCSR
jgi:hypothetical protein